MKISTILDHIDSGHMALPEFQRGYVWNRDQVRGLFESMYRRHPVGSLLVWATESHGAQHRGDARLAPGAVKMLLDGQQRMTSIYGVVRNKPPKFFDGNEKAFTGLRFHIEKEEFSFYSPVAMRDDPLWIDVSELMIKGTEGLGHFVIALSANPEHATRVGDYAGRLIHLFGITEIDLHVEEVTGPDKTIDVVVDIFNRVNSGGTKLSKGDLALAKICADWPEARERMKVVLKGWEREGYDFNLDWLLRNVNTVITGEAKFQFLHNIEAERVEDGLKRGVKAVNKILNLISGRLGLDHDQVFFGRYAIPVLSRYLDRRGAELNDVERDRLLFWFVQSAMWGRFSGSTESFIDQDLGVIEEQDGALDRLIEQLRFWHGGLEVEPGHFTGWSLGARFYPVLYMLTRMGEARDWGDGLPLKKGMLGKMSQLEVHHIFPKALLYKNEYNKTEVNAVANFCFLTKDTNLKISDTAPNVYFPKVESAHPGALESQWVPMDPDLWNVEYYREFLEARRHLLAEATNSFMAELLHDDQSLLDRLDLDSEASEPTLQASLGGVESSEEEAELADLRAWIEERGLPDGNYMHELADPSTGIPVAVLDLAWPSGLQEGLSQSVAVLLNEGPEVMACANRFGFRYFTDADAFKRYVESDILVEDDA